MFKSTKLAIAAALILSTATAALASKDSSSDPGGFVVPGSMDGVNPAYHPQIFGSSQAREAWGYAPLPRTLRHLQLRRPNHR